MVLWCNGSTRDFGSLRDCSIQSRTTHLLDKKYFFHLCTSACESSSALFIIHFFKCFFYLNNLSFFSTACDKSLSYALKAIR